MKRLSDRLFRPEAVTGHGQPAAAGPAPEGEAAGGTLPVLATGDDVRELVMCLSKKPAGLTVVQALNSDLRRLFDERKIAAYKFWGVLEQEEGRLRLTPFGQEFAVRLRQEAEAYRVLLRGVESYSAALKWIYEEGLEVVPFDLVAALWRRQYPASEGLLDDETAKGNVVCFFHLCQSADLGVVTLGKRTQPARIRVDRDELDRWVAPPGETEESRLAALYGARAPRPQAARPADGRVRFFVSYREHDGLARRFQEMLRLLDFEGSPVPRDGGVRHLVPEPRLSAMRACQGAVVVVGDDDLRDGGADGVTLDEQIRVELGAACALYGRQIILIWRCEAPLPDELRDLHHVRVTGADFTWAEGSQVLSLLKGLRPRHPGGVTPDR